MRRLGYCSGVPLAAVGVLLLSSVARADAPEGVREVHVLPSSAAGEPPASLGRTLSVTLTPGTLEPLLKRAAEEHKEFGLYLDGWFFKGLARPASAAVDEVRFVLDRTQDNREAWTRVFTSFDLNQHTKPVEVTVGLANGQVVPLQKRVNLELYPKVFGIVALVGAVLFAFGVIAIGKWTSALRDVGETAAGRLGAYSLARVQMAWWTVWIVLAFVYLWAVTGEAQSLTASLLALMGLGSGTALCSVTIDHTKLGAAKTAMAGLKADADALDLRVAAVPATDAAAPVLQQQAREASAALRTRSEAQRSVSRWFVADILSEDGKGIAFHRIQMVIWTLVLTMIFVGATVTKLAMPELDPVLLGLLGISSGTYLGFKIPEKS